jgi:hypothetical protein
MTVALKGSLTRESVVVRVSSRRMRRATSRGTVKAGVAAWAAMVRRSRTVIMAREYPELDDTGFTERPFVFLNCGLIWSSSFMREGKSRGLERCWFVVDADETPATINADSLRE